MENGQGGDDDDDDNDGNDGNDSFFNEKKHKRSKEGLAELLLDPTVAQAFLKSTFTTLNEFATYILHHEFYQLPSYVSEADLVLIKQTAMNGFRSWLRLGLSIGNNIVDVINSISNFDSVNGAINAILNGESYEIWQMEYEYAQEVIKDMISTENLSNPHVWCNDYTYWGNLEWMLNKWGMKSVSEFTPDSYKIFGQGNSFVIITLAEQNRLNSKNADT